MRKHSQKLSVLMLIALLIVVLAVCLVACDPAKDPQTPSTPSTPEEHTTHTPDSTTEWHSDDTDHWHLCVEGGEPLEKAQHDFELKNDDNHHYLECKVCHKIKDTEEHTTVVRSDENGHWLECTKEGCGYTTQPTEHTYGTTAVDAGEGKHTLTCTYEGCGHTKQEDHTLSYKHLEEGGHRQECSLCDYATAKEDCAKAEDADYTDLEDGENHTFVCEKCEETVTEAHTLSAWRGDGASHYKVCTQCDATLESGTCTPSEDYTHDGTEHYKTCTTCERPISATRATCDLEWKQDENKENHFQYCAVCKYETEHQPHSTKQEKKADVDGVNHGYTCETCSLGYGESPHDYTGNSADCVECGYDDGTWKFELINGKDEYQIVGSDETKLSRDEVTFPSLYKGKKVTKLSKAENGVTDALSFGGDPFKKVIIPEGYTVIGAQAFTYSNIDDLYLPASLTSIEMRAFPLRNNYYRNRKNIHVVSLEFWANLSASFSSGVTSDHPYNNPFYSDQDNWEKQETAHKDIELYVGEEHITELELPVTAEGEVKGDWRYMHLTAIKLPASFTTWNAKIGYNSQDGGISKLIVSNLAEFLNTKTDITYYVSKNGNVDVELYEGEEQVTELTIPSSVTNIISNRIRFKGVKKLTFEGTPTIGNAVISLPDCTQISVPTLEALFTLNKGGEFFASFNEGNGVEAYLGADELKAVKLTAETANDLAALTPLTNLQQVTAGEGAELDASIANLFAGDSALEFVDFGNATLTLNEGKFGANAFKGCAALTKLVLPESVTGFENGQFEGADALSRIFVKGDADKVKALAEAIEGGENNGALALATLYTFSDATPGDQKADKELKWHYDADGAVQLWDEEPECARHAFAVSWDNDFHWQQCTQCEYKLDSTKAEHSLGTEIEGNETGHWQTCADCGAQAGMTGPHVTEQQQYESDGHQHWLICDECGKIAGKKTDCVPGEEYETDAESHWQTCTVCKNLMDKVKHNYTTDEDGFVDGICQDCGYSVWTFADGAITAYKGSKIEKLAVPKTIDGQDVTIIGKDGGAKTDVVFKSDCGIVELKLPEGLLTVGAYAFYDGSHRLTTLTKVYFSSTITKICESAFQYCSSLKDVALPETLTTLEKNAFSSCSSIENFKIPNGVTSFDYSTYPNVRHVIIGTGITQITARSFSSKSSCRTIEFMSELTAIGDNAFQTATAGINVYFRNSLETLKPLLEATKSNYLTKLKDMNIYCYDANDPTGKEYDFGDYIDGTWREVNGKPSIWNVDYIMFDHGLSDDPLIFDLNNDSDDKTLLLASYLYAASGEVRYTSLTEGATITSAEGLATFTVPGTFKFKVELDGKSETFVELVVNVFSSKLYLEGNINDKTYSEPEKDNSFTAGTPSTSSTATFTGSFKENDRFSIHLLGTALTIGKANVAENDLAEDGDYTKNKITFEENGDIKFGIAGTYQIKVVYNFGEQFSITLSISRRNNIKAVHIAGVGEFDLGDGKYYASVTNSDYDYDATLTIRFKNSDFPEDKQNMTRIAFVVELTDGTLEWYGKDDDSHQLITFTGKFVESQPTGAADNRTWVSPLDSNKIWWGRSDMKYSSSNGQTVINWTFSLTLTVDNELTAVSISQSYSK